MKVCIALPSIHKYKSRYKMFKDISNLVDKEYLITDYINNKLEYHENKSNFTLYSLFEGKKKKPVFIYAATKKLLELNKSGNIDIIHDIFFNLFPIFISKSQTVPKSKLIMSIYARNIGWLYETRHIEPYNDIGYNLLRMYNIFSEYACCKKADGIIVNSNQLVSDLINYLDINPRKIKYIPSSVDIDYFKKLNITRDILNFNEEDIILLFVGNVFRLKGIYDLLESIPLIKQRYSNVKLIIIGNIHNYEKENISNTIEKLSIGNNVIFLGSVLQEEILKYYSIADIFMFPSLLEGSPRVIKEAILCGCPVVGTDIPGIRSIDENEEFISFSRIHDPSNLAKNVIDLLENQSLRESVIKKGILHVKREFNPPKIAKMTFDFYNEVM